ncbi:DHA2 family efflux MFS transporter permease subunit [Burkholderiaceae bacterium DAT-1]|nr:DHA2 family efflux MFS transporter permease subunit [Burkholderiaceae bacterium DAT-1]
MSNPATQAAGGALPPIRGTQLVWLTLAVALATFMEVLDTTIVNVSVPTIAGNLAVSSSQGTWAISSYSVAAAIAVPLTGWLARRFGEVRVFLTSVFLFTIMSMLCGLATNLPMLVFFRLMQGLVSGPMVPLSQTLLLANYPPHKKGLALALWAMTVIVAPIFGPLLGGYITEVYSWPWIFYINAPVGVFSGWIAWRVLKGRETPTVKQPIDVVGLVLLVVGVGALQLMLDNGNDLDWFSSTFICALTVIAVIALSFLVVWELTDPHPIVDLRLFELRNFRIGVITLSFGITAFMGSTVLFPLWLQTVMGYTPSWAGMATAPVGILAFILSPIVGKNMHKMDLRIAASASFVIFAITMHWFSTFSLDTDFSHIVMPRLFQGIGVALFFVPINQIVLSGIGPSRMAAASGLSNFFRTLAGGFSTAVTVTIWEHHTDFHHARLMEHISSTSAATQGYMEKLQGIGMSVGGSYAHFEGLVQRQAAQLATTEIFWGFSMVFVALIGVIWLAKPPFGSTGGGGGH